MSDGGNSSAFVDEVEPNYNVTGPSRDSRKVKSPILDAGIAASKALCAEETERGVWVQAYYRLGFAISRWLDLLPADASFASAFVSLTDDEVAALMTRPDLPDDDDTDADARDVTLADLAERVQERIDALVPESDGGRVFLKLDSRSPKDVVFEDDTIGVPLVRAAFDDAGLLGSGADACAEATAIAYRVLHNTGLGVSTGAEAVARIHRSRRCREDLASLQRNRRNAFPLDNAICLRAFDDGVANSPWPEFRAFVHCNQLTAISQYDHKYRPEVPPLRETLKAELVEFFNTKIREPLSEGFATYIIDFAMDDDRNIKVVELNSFESWTGACLFRWSDDFATLLHGPEDGGVAFRIVEDASAEASHDDNDWVSGWRGLSPAMRRLIVSEEDDPITRLRAERDAARQVPAEDTENKSSCVVQ